jgi:hypothetical protein
MHIIYIIVFIMSYGFMMAHLKERTPDQPLVRVILSLLTASCGPILLTLWALAAYFLGMEMPWSKGWKLF